MGIDLITNPLSDVSFVETNGYTGIIALAPGHISTDNSTSTPLGIDGVFTGEWENVVNFGIISVTINTDQASVTDGLCVDFSSDGTNIDASDQFTIPADTGKTFSFQAATQYFRVKYTNGGVAQTHFRLQTKLSPYYVKPSSHRIDDPISAEDDAELVKSVLTGKNPNNNFINFEATNGGNFKISLEELENDISVNSNSQLKVTPYDSSGTEIFTDGNDIGDVTVNNSSGASAVNIQDGGNSITVDQSTHDNLNTNANIQVSDTDASSLNTVPVTQYDSSGNEGQKIIGVDYLSGNSGIDAATETLQTITYEHHEIHSGSHFNYCDYTLNEGSGNTIEFVLTTPNTTKWMHLTFEVSASEGATIELYEGTTGVTGGTTITPRNNNRNSTTVSTVTLVKDPTSITTDGTRASGYLAGGGRTAGAVGREREFVLKQNESYLVRITSLAVSNDIGWCAEWYEHTDKN